MDIVSWTLGQGQNDPHKPLYIDPNEPTRCLSLIETHSLVRRLVSGFKSKGLRTGDCVCIMSFNDIFYSSLVLGIMGSGGVFAGANPGHTEHELAHQIKTTGAKFMLVAPKLLDVAIEAAKSCNIPKSNLFVLNLQGEQIPEGYQSWLQLLEHGEQDWVYVEDPDNTTAAYFSTSGTSGLPKAAVIPHSYLVSQGEMQVLKSEVSYELSTIIALPPFHAFTFPLQHLLPLRTGTPCYVMPRFDQNRLLNAVNNFGITQMAVVPPIMVALSKCEDGGKLSSLERIYTGGSCASVEMQQQFYAKLSSHARIEQVYGMSECGWVTNWQLRHIDSTSGIGQPFPGYALRLVDENGGAVTAESVTGEIEIYVPHPMKGYLNNITATADSLTKDGWIRSGDVGYFDNGSWYIVDRTKDLIKVRGWQVSPAEIETVLLEHHAIIDAAVTGKLAIDGENEVPIAFVVRSCECRLLESHVKSFLATRLAGYKMVQEVLFVERIPRNAAGKILRRVLRESLRSIRQMSDDQLAVASAYSAALRDLERSQKRRRSSIDDLAKLDSRLRSAKLAINI